MSRSSTKRSTKLPEQLHEAQQGASADDGGRALQIAYRFLNRRERTVAEVRARLEREDGIGAETIQVVIEELLGYGYLDDARYARVFAQDRRTLDQWGGERIARTLRERGVARDLIEVAVQELVDDAPESELERAQALLIQRFPCGPAEPRDRDRAFGVLVRKGYDSEISADAVRAWARGGD